MDTHIKNLWEKFKKEIIYRNRYFAGGEILNLLSAYKPVRMFPDNTKIDFYRARIGNFINEDISNLLAPPEGKASSGRCNPEGISYLYLSSCKKTAVCEVRPANGDTLSVAQIKVDVSNIFSFRVHLYDSKFNIEIDNSDLKSLISLIDFELSLKITNETKLSYLPLQFISEYIKSIGFDGFVYSSTVGPGMNLVMFNWENKIEVVDKSIVKVDNIEYGLS